MKNQPRILMIENGGILAGLIESGTRGPLPDEFSFHNARTLSEAGRMLARAKAFDAIVLDLDLADTDGLSSLARLRKDHPCIPLVALTGNGDFAGDVDLLGNLPQDILHKGDLSPRLLRGVLRHAVSRQQSVAQLQDANSRLELKNRQLAKIQETANQFVDNISHEFRTPLTVSKEFTSIISEGLAGELTAQQEEFLNIVNDRADDLAVMVDDMLDTGKLEAGMLSVWRRRCNMADIVDRVRETLLRKANVKKVTFAVVVPDELPEVYCDPEKIGRVIINLAVNSIKFTPAEGSVTLRASHNHKNSEILVSVSDNGPGIEPHEIKHIFQRFQQAANTARSARQGAGLGLSIAKELVDLNLGQIDVASRPGQGSTFSFTVPLFDPPNLVNRHLRRLRIPSCPAAVLSLLVATTEPQHNHVACGPGLSVVVDEFLQHTFRGDDLVIRSHTNKWVVLSSCPKYQTDKLIERVQSDWTQMNRNRPGEKFPDIRLVYKGTWAIDEDIGELCKHHRLQMHAEPGTPPSPRILVVDDDSELTRGLGIRLKAAGYDVLTAKDGKTGMETAVNTHPDAILMDNYMPGLGGMEVINKLRQHPETTDIPVIMLSGGVQEEQLALKRGIRYFLHKPCDPRAVAAAIRDVITTNPMAHNSRLQGGHYKSAEK